MLKPHLNHHHRQTSGSPIITRAKKAFITGDGSGSDASGNPTSFLSHNTLAFPVKRHIPFCSKRNSVNSVGQIKAVAGESSTASVVKTVSVKAVITVQMTVGGVIENLSFTRPLDDITDLLGKSLLLELVAAETDPSVLVDLVIVVKGETLAEAEAGYNVEYTLDSTLRGYEKILD
ncbi:linoleate 13S-lipoxygenase 2-1, chloroplastic-like protein [Tanacetum coccineum]